MATIERTPDAVLDFWFGPLRSAADASRENWQQAMLKWRVGPFARSAEDKSYLEAQQEWCHQMHRDGLDRFFGDPVWDTPDGWLAKLILIDQFPRSVYRGTPLAYMNDSIAFDMAREAATTKRDTSQYNIIERFWIYFPLAHAEDLTIQELSVDKLTRWSADLVVEVPPELRRINQFVTWAIVKGAIEHAEALLSFGRFPHRNAIMKRPHRGGEPRYLTDSMRPLWSFTQPPSPDYFAILGALCRMEDGLDEDRITSGALAALLRSAGLTPDQPDSPMDVFDLAGGDTVAYPVLYRHLLLPEKAPALENLRRLPLVVQLMNEVKALILVDEDRTWPPKSARHSVTRVIDIVALKAIVDGSGSSEDAVPPGPPVEDAREPGDDADRVEPPARHSPELPRTLSLVIGNDNRELGRVAAAVDEFAQLRRFSQRTLFEVQLCIEEVLMHIVEHCYDDAETHDIRLDLEMDDEGRTLVIRTVDDGIHRDPTSDAYRPESLMEEHVADGLGLHLVREYVDELSYRREDDLNHLSLSKSI